MPFSPWSELRARMTSTRRIWPDSRRRVHQRRATVSIRERSTEAVQPGPSVRPGLLAQEPEAVDAAHTGPCSGGIGHPARSARRRTLWPRLCGRRHHVGAACARSQERPKGCRCRRRGGDVRVADGRAWRGGRSLTALASGGRRGSCGNDRAARPRWAHGRPARQRGDRRRQGSAPPRRKRRRPEQAPPSAPPQPSALPHASAPAQPEAAPVNNAVLWHVDNSALPLSEPRRYRDRAHLEFVASQPCLLCGRQPSDAHHLRFMQPRAMRAYTRE
jgi:hypothetical protein